MRSPSKVLFKLLKELLVEFGQKFPNIANNQITDFTVLSGCDDYIARLSRLKLDTDAQMKTTLLTADFGDAYTETGINHIQDSVSEIGKVLGSAEEKLDLIKRLVESVFSNCYFFTPNGLFRQTRGMPMGDVSSRDALDIDLAYSEYNILSLMSTISF